MNTWMMTDRRTGRAVEIRRPMPTQLAGAEVVELERIAGDWGVVSRQEQAEVELNRMAGDRPERVLYGLLWLTGLWCSLCHARLGLPLDEIVEGLDYQGPLREASGFGDEGWEASNAVMRRGVRYVLSSDEEITKYLVLVQQLNPGLLRTRWHLLVTMDGFSQDMQRNDLAPWGAAAHLVKGAGWDGD